MGTGTKQTASSKPTSDLRSAVVRSLGPVAAGLAVGLVGAAFASRLIESELYGVTAADPPTYVGVAAVMLLTAVFASTIPAWRATRVDPAEVLSAE